VQKNGYTVMSKPLPDRLIGKPIVELFDRTAKDLGKYLGDVDVRSAAQIPTMVESAAEFLAQVCRGLELQSVPKGPPRALLKTAVVGARVRRNPAQARAAKRRDGYRCQVCFLRPEELYGSIKAQACLDAHHLVGVRTEHGRVSELSKIITVCANCHRFVEADPLSKRDLLGLQRRLRGRIAAAVAP
jgi:hypothetical protein